MLARAFVSHYRRHPFQLLALAVMIVLATMLWTGVTVLTDQARNSLLQSEDAVAARAHVIRSDGDRWVWMILRPCVWLACVWRPGWRCSDRRRRGG